MYTLWPHTVRHVLLLSLYVLACSASSSYYIVVPSNTIEGANLSFAVHWFGDSAINVSAGMRHNGNNIPPIVTKIVQKDSIEIFTLPGIAVQNIQNFNWYELVVNGSSQNTSIFSQIIYLPSQLKNASAFIQTDKTLYKPGETVRIRIIAVNYDFKPDKRDVNLVIRDPRYNIVQQNLNIKSDLGVISTQFKLADKPMLGKWIIEAKTDDSNQNTAFFSVAENVFKKFDVILDAPSFFVDLMNFTGAVTANYHYGKPVKGNVTITLKPAFAAAVTEVTKTYAILGSANFSFTFDEIANISYWGGITITATVYEEVTGFAVEESSFIWRENTLYRLVMISQNPAFEAGMNFTAQIQVQRIDNKPLTKEERSKNVSVRITQGSGGTVSSVESYGILEAIEHTSLRMMNDNFLWQNYTISESGIVNVEFTVQQASIWTRLEIEYQDSFQQFSFEKQIMVNPIIQINISETSLKVGTPFHLQVKTFPEVQDIYYVVIAKGMVVAAGKNKTIFSLTPQQSWAPASRLVLYTLNENSSFGDIMQTTQMLLIQGALKNQITLSWSKNSAKPLETVSLSINVKESRSLVGLQIVEKSSMLQDTNDLTFNRVDNDTLKYYENFPNSVTDGVVYNIWGMDGIPLLRNERSVEGNPTTYNNSDFIETWIWLDTNISSSLSTNILVTVPDKNTTWVATAFVMSEGLGLGVTGAPVELSVLKPIFMTLNMPNTLTRGEQFILEVMLSNALKEDLQVTITLDSSTSFDIIEPNSNTDFVPGQRNVTVLRQNGTIVLFPIRPKVLGNITITVKATSTAASDTLTSYIIVKPEGVKYYYSETAVLDARSPGNTPTTISKNFMFTFPTDLVQGSEEAFITVVGDYLGPSIKGLESLISMPYGCGEQNMINFAPNIYILLYLITTGQITPTIREKTISFTEQGYQRELSYLRNDGSFSAFGNSDSSGSTWLTAFVFRCFLQAQPFIYINPDVLNQAAVYLISYQDTNTGIFSEPGRVIHRDLQGGHNGPITLTAYILASLLQDENDRTTYTSNVQKAVQYLEGKYEEGIASNYTLSVVVYALTLANSTKAQAALNQLNARTTTFNGTKYWSTPSQSANFYWQPSTTDIETAAYALLSFLRQNRIVDGMPVMKWLGEQRNQFGGYGSTQDTIMALLALSQFAAALPSTQTSLVVTVTGPGSFVPKTFQVNPSPLVVQSKQIEVSQPLSITTNAVGYGLALVQFNVGYNRMVLSRRRRSTAPEPFSLDLKVKEDINDIYRLTVDASMSYLEGDQTGMVLVEFGFLNGFELGPEGIPTNDQVKLVEIKKNQVNLYLDSLTKNTLTVSVPMVRSAMVTGSQDAVVKVTEYYITRNTVTRTYNSATMKNTSACNFCGFNCAQCKSNVQVKQQTSSACTPTFLMLCMAIVFLPFLI